MFQYNEDGSIWSQMGNFDVEANVEDVAMSADGQYIAVGCPTYKNNAGCVEIYVFNDPSWELKAKKVSFAESFGTSVSLSEDGSSLAVGTGGVDNGIYIYTNGR